MQSEPPTRFISSWGNVVRAAHAVAEPADRNAPFPELRAASSLLPFGNGRSYGDSCLNVGGGLLCTRALDRFIAWDRESGVLRCEAGVLLDAILDLVLPEGWFLPVTPGTRFVTVGGAIANDVHGKNHHRAGTFGCHIRRLELLRSDGRRLECSAVEHPDWFGATIGGLGLTGLITWAEIQLRRVAGPGMDVESIRFANLEEFIGLCDESDRDFEYTVAWVDCQARGPHLGRGVLQRANHAERAPTRRPRHGGPRGVPFTPPVSLVNRATTRLFNVANYRRQRARTRALRHYEGFFYPLDGILHWNRMYGPRGMFQYQCVVPPTTERGATERLFEAIARHGQASFLAVLKRFGTRSSPGMLSFPQEGLTLAVDFPNRGEPLERLFLELDAIIKDAGGRLYPAKDGRMPGDLFRSGYPRWREFTRFIDPRVSSSFWRRVMADA